MAGTYQDGELLRAQFAFQRFRGAIEPEQALAPPGLVVLLVQRHSPVHVELAGPQELDGGRPAQRRLPVPFAPVVDGPDELGHGLCGGKENGRRMTEERKRSNKTTTKIQYNATGWRGGGGEDG